MKAYIRYSSVTDSWGLEGLPEDDQFYGIYSAEAIAHDLLEHVNGLQNVGTFEDEFEALGVLYKYRVLSMHPSLRNPRKNKTLVGAFAGLFEHPLLWEKYSNIPTTPLSKKEMRSPVYLSALDAAEEVVAEYHDEKPDVTRQAEGLVNLATRHAFIGMKKAEQRYRRVDFIGLFDSMVYTIKDYFTNKTPLEDYFLDTSTIWEISYSLSHYDVTIKPVRKTDAGNYVEYM